MRGARTSWWELLRRMDTRCGVSGKTELPCVQAAVEQLTIPCFLDFH